jgi:hypothetical protein
MQSFNILSPKPVIMRQIVTLMGLMLCIQLTAQTKKNIDSKIEKVMVFFEGAQVQRSGKSSLAAGKFEFSDAKSEISHLLCSHPPVAANKPD